MGVFAGEGQILLFEPYVNAAIREPEDHLPQIVQVAGQPIQRVTDDRVALTHVAGELGGLRTSPFRPMREAGAGQGGGVGIFPVEPAVIVARVENHGHAGMDTGHEFVGLALGLPFTGQLICYSRQNSEELAPNASVSKKVQVPACRVSPEPLGI